MLETLNIEKKPFTVLLCGSSSEIGHSVIDAFEIPTNSKLILIGKNTNLPEALEKKFLDVEHIDIDFQYVHNYEEIQVALLKIRNIDLAILSIGVLPQENNEFDLHSIQRIFFINGLANIMLISIISDIMRKQNEGLLIYISSIAIIRPRNRNFSYGSSKIGVDFYARGLSQKYRKSKFRIIIVRPGFVYTKMTKHLKPAPFAIETITLKKIIAKSLKRKRTIVYTPRILWIIAKMLPILPSRVLNRF